MTHIALVYIFYCAYKEIEKERDIVIKASQ